MSEKEIKKEVTERDLSAEHEIRVQKVEQLKAAGEQAWPEYKPVTATCQQALSEFVDGEESEKVYELAGRLTSRREHGKTIFGNISDRSGAIQLYIRKDNIGEELFEKFKKFFDVGDIVWVRGSLFKTRLGEVTVKVEQIELLSKCLHPLPEKYHGLVDVEQRYRQRYLDLISNPESRARFIKRSKIVQAIRNFLLKRDFLEVETPMLHPIPGGATAKPFVTHHNAYDMDLYLRIAPELYLKRLVVGGFDRVFEINRNFRNEGVSTKHNPEFTMIEFYMAHGDYRDGMDLTEKMIRESVIQESVTQESVKQNFDSLDITFGDHELSFKTPFKRMTIEESLVEIGGFSKEDLNEKNIDKIFKKNNLEIRKGDAYGEKLFFLFEAFVEEKLIQPTFITGYPIEVSPLAKRDPQDSAVAARFELFVAGMELANGFTELNDPIDQAGRFRQQASRKESGDEEAHHYDADYIKALEYGLPPTVGVGVGIDRLVMLLTNTTSIKDIILFPTMKRLHE
ncbi:lysine--tRNA ligase [Candidatus Babeliales bacterium]|nr:lysine--tRNA ligase [Candidatus Babeliales bacterium]